MAIHILVLLACLLAIVCPGGAIFYTLSTGFLQPILCCSTSFVIVVTYDSEGTSFVFALYRLYNDGSGTGTRLFSIVSNNQNQPANIVVSSSYQSFTTKRLQVPAGDRVEVRG